MLMTKKYVSSESLRIAYFQKFNKNVHLGVSTLLRPNTYNLSTKDKLSIL